jgi:aminomethyltransferase
MMVVNGSNKEKDLAHVLRYRPSFDCTIEDRTDEIALLAVQGPATAGILQALTETDLSAIKYYHFAEGAVGGVPTIISRTGYTGEDGFELFVRPNDAPRVWRLLVEAGAVPVGLGARDTLRLEAGMCLYGHELDAETTPLEAGIGFAVSLDKEQEFVGQEALRREKEEGLKKRLVAFKVEGRGIARHDYPVAVGGETVGSVTSGTLSPTLGEAIGLALVAPDVEDEFEVVIRNRPVAARTVPLPFYKRDKK